MRNSSLILALSACALALTACGGGGSGSAMEQRADESDYQYASRLSMDDVNTAFQDACTAYYTQTNRDGQYGRMLPGIRAMGEAEYCACIVENVGGASDQAMGTLSGMAEREGGDAAEAMAEVDTGEASSYMSKKTLLDGAEFLRETLAYERSPDSAARPSMSAGILLNNASDPCEARARDLAP